MLHTNVTSGAAGRPAVEAARRVAPRRDDRHGDARIVPLARGLAMLSTFSPEQQWLGSQEIAERTGVPAPTVSRMLASMTTLGYLHYDSGRRKYRLAAASLSLGYAAIADAEAPGAVRAEMRRFAEGTDTYMILGTRDKLDVSVLETQVGEQAVLDLQLSAGSRLAIASCPMGWALLAALPEQERFYLEDHLERRSGRDWPVLRRRMAEGMSQLLRQGFCTSLADEKAGLVSVAVPVQVPDHPPAVLACVGRSGSMPRARVERDLGPRLAATARTLQGMQC